MIKVNSKNLFNKKFKLKLMSPVYLKSKITLFTILYAIFIGCAILVLVTSWVDIREKIFNWNKYDPTKPTTLLVNGKKVPVQPRVLQITPKELNIQIESKQKIIIVQIGTYEEWQEGHIAGALFSTKGELANGPIIFGREDNVVLVSEDGEESALVAVLLISGFGFNNKILKNLEGGLKAWEKAGFKLMK